MLLRRVLCCALTLVALEACSRDVPPARPSVILVSLDTLRADHTSLFGYERDTTPFLAALAEESTLFLRAFSVSGWTLTAHMSLLTGLYPPQHAVTEETKALSPQVPLLAEVLNSAGYQTVGLYFPGWIDARYGFGRGFDRFESHLTGEEALQHLEGALDELDEESPTFLFLHLFDAHCRRPNEPGSPYYQPPEPYARWYSEGAVDRLAASDLSTRWEGAGVHDEEREDLVALYDGGVRYVDSLVERVLSDLDRRGLLDDAWLIVTADHGESLGQRGGHMRTHGDVFQEGLHVPLLLRPPGGAPGRTVEAAVSLVDVFPTVLGELGIEVPPGLPGRSLLGPLAEDRVVYARSSIDAWIQWPWKVIESDGERGAFHLELDPGELHPLGRDTALYSEHEATVTGIPEAFAAQAGGDLAPRAAPLPVGELPGKTREALGALGYGDTEGF